MAQKTSWSAGQVLAQAEGSIGTTLRVAVANYYKGQDLGTAQLPSNSLDTAGITSAPTISRTGERFFFGIYDVAGDTVIDDFRHGAAIPRDDRRSAGHRLDHHEPERLRPVDREQQCACVAQK